MTAVDLSADTAAALLQLPIVLVGFDAGGACLWHLGGVQTRACPLEQHADVPELAEALRLVLAGEDGIATVVESDDVWDVRLWPLRDGVGEVTGGIALTHASSAPATTSYHAWARPASDQEDALGANVGTQRPPEARYDLHDELQQAHHLESVGRLAGGIAHEINTPIQFIGDNVRFLQESFATTVELLETYRSCLFGESDMPRADRVAAAEAAEQAADVHFLMAEVPQAADETLEGVERVASIVRAMKTVGRAPQRVQGPADLNAAIESTIVVSRSEHKRLARVVLDLGDLPPVVCHVGELNQVFINLIVNAAHAIAEKHGGSGELGTITIRTRLDGDEALIEVSDDGCGMREGVRRRIFDPFFTTKDVGRGTGQGLSLSRAIITERHGGTIAVESTPGVGTTFTIRLPVDGVGDEARRGPTDA